MNPAISVFMERAWEDLRTARHDLEGGFVRAAISRAYYAAFHAARAALLTEGECPSHTVVCGIDSGITSSERDVCRRSLGKSWM